MTDVENRMRLIDPPWLAKIELTTGCNLRCKFCPVFSRPEYQGAQNTMTAETADEIGFQLSLLNDGIRIEFAMRGEPTLNPDIEEVLRTLRRHLPMSQMSMFTNGVQWLKDETTAARLLDAGLNFFNVDCYNGTYGRFHALSERVLRKQRPDVELTDFREISAYSKQRNGHRRKIVNLVPDIADPGRLVRVRKLHNVAGNLTPEQEEMFGMEPVEPGSIHKKCVRPFREIAVASNGDILICCQDWSNADVLGNVHREGIRDVWYGDTHLAIMRALYDGKREKGACARCSYFGGWRQGLLRNPHTGESYRDKPRVRA